MLETCTFAVVEYKPWHKAAFPFHRAIQLCRIRELVYRQLRERLLHERESAVEGERATAQKRLGEAAERYEASAAQARMNLVADHDRRLAEAEDAWRMQVCACNTDELNHQYLSLAILVL